MRLKLTDLHSLNSFELSPSGWKKINQLHARSKKLDILLYFDCIKVIRKNGIKSEIKTRKNAQVFFYS